MIFSSVRRFSPKLISKKILVQALMMATCSSSFAEGALSLNGDCVNQVKKSFGSVKFQMGDPMDKADFATVCTNNTGGRAVDCMNQVLHDQQYQMFATGVAEVCSGGVSGKSASSCLNQNLPYFQSLKNQGFIARAFSPTVDACNGVARRLAACDSHGDDTGIVCKGPPSDHALGEAKAAGGKAKNGSDPR